MKKVLVLFGRRKWKTQSPFKVTEKKYRLCYEYFYSLAEKNGIKIYTGSYQWYDKKNKLFKYAWEFDKGKWKRAKNIIPDLIYDKTKLRAEVHLAKKTIAKNYPILNNIGFTLIANNKYETGILLPKYFKKYFEVRSKKALDKIIKKIRGTKVVLKPSIGSGGKDVLILEKKELAKNKLAFPVIAQEFIDSSGGIKNIVQGAHDLRLVFIDNDLIYSYVRQPAKGLLLANLAQGGSMFIVEKRILPKKLLPIIKAVQKTFRQYNPKIYTIDFIFDKDQRPWIVELNTMPGMYFSSDQKKWMDKMYLAMINTFKQTLK